MRNMFALSMIVMFILVGCSEERVSENSETISVKDETIANISNEEVSEEKAVSDVEKTLEEAIPTNVENSTTEVNVQEEKEIEIIEEQTSVNDAEAKQEINLYELYSEADTETKDAEVNEEVPVNDLNYEQFEEGIMLPTFEDNKELIREGDIVKMKLKELEDIVSYIEEPITEGYVVAFDLLKLQQKYNAKSYSVHDGESEVGLMILEEESDIGILLVEEANYSLEDIQNLDIMIIN